MWSKLKAFLRSVKARTFDALLDAITGQTAPGDGVCVGDYQVVIGTHDAIIR